MTLFETAWFEQKDIVFKKLLLSEVFYLQLSISTKPQATADRDAVTNERLWSLIRVVFKVYSLSALHTLKSMEPCLYLQLLPTSEVCKIQLTKEMMAKWVIIGWALISYISLIPLNLLALLN